MVVTLPWQMEVEVAEQKEPCTQTWGFWLGSAALTLLSRPIRCFIAVYG
jgi:hypothetical protein